MLPIIIAVMSSICIPYVYYAVLVKNYMNATMTPQELVGVPQLKDFYRTLIGVAVTQGSKMIIGIVFYYPFLKIAKGDDEATRQSYAKKCCEYLFKSIYFSVSAYWGWSIMNKHDYLY